MTSENNPTAPPFKVVSGGQTGVDRAALDAALHAGIPVGGWCPRGRRAMDGTIPGRYPLTETESSNYAVRTEWNVRDSDATLILNTGFLAGGTRLTRAFAMQLQKPVLMVDLQELPNVRCVVDWLIEKNVHVLNVAGPREESQPGCHALATRYLSKVFSCIHGELFRLT